MRCRRGRVLPRAERGHTAGGNYGRNTRRPVPVHVSHLLPAGHTLRIDAERAERCGRAPAAHDLRHITSASRGHKRILDQVLVLLMSEEKRLVEHRAGQERECDCNDGAGSPARTAMGSAR